MQIKEGSGRKAGYNDKKGVYGAEVVFRGSWDCYEISAEIFNSLTKGMRGSEAEALITGGRHLYMHVNDCCGPPTPWCLTTITGITAPGWAARTRERSGARS